MAALAGGWILQGFCPTFVASDHVRLALGGQRVWEGGYELGENRKACGQ